MSIEIVFETHSTTRDNELGIASGHADVDLSPRGEREAAALGRGVAGKASRLSPISGGRGEQLKSRSGTRALRSYATRDCASATTASLTGHSVDEIDAYENRRLASHFLVTRVTAKWSSG